MHNKRKALEKVLAQLAKLLPHLGNENDGEALAAVRKITALLKRAGLDWHDVVALLRGSGPSVLEMLQALLEHEADALVRLGLAGASLFFSTKGVAYADVATGNHVLTLPLKSPEFSDWLVEKFFHEKKRAPKLSSERDAIRTLTAHARYQGGRCEVYLRSAMVGGALLLDIGDETGRCIEVTPTGWRVLATAPVKFQRMRGMAALPLPERGGDIKELRQFTNLTDSAFILYVAVLTNSLFPGRPHVLLNLIGDSGSGKTTAARVARSLTDPNEVPTGTLPREARDLFADVNASIVLSYDNASSIPKSISDSLCQITSGTGFRKRKLYSDLDLILVGGYRTVILTSVHDAVVEPDLAERCVRLHLSHIVERHSEVGLWREFERQHATIFGALLDIIVHGLNQLPRTQVAGLPRLADFALWGAAIEGAFAPRGSFLAAFNACQAAATDAVVELSPTAAAVAAFMENRGAWVGTTTELWRELQRDQTEARPTETKGWPKDPVAFGIALSKAISTLRKIGIALTRDRATSRKRTPMVHLRRVEQEEPRQQQYGAPGTAEGSEGSEGLVSNRALVRTVVPFPEK